MCNLYYEIVIVKRTILPYTYRLIHKLPNQNPVSQKKITRTNSGIRSNSLYIPENLSEIRSTWILLSKPHDQNFVRLFGAEEKPDQK